MALQFQVQDQDRENSEMTAGGAAVLVFCLLSAALNMFLLVQVCFNKGNSSSYSYIWNVRKIISRQERRGWSIKSR